MKLSDIVNPAFKIGLFPDNDPEHVYVGCLNIANNKPHVFNTINLMHAYEAGILSFQNISFRSYCKIDFYNKCTKLLADGYDIVFNVSDSSRIFQNENEVSMIRYEDELDRITQIQDSLDETTLHLSKKDCTLIIHYFIQEKYNEDSELLDFYEPFWEYQILEIFGRDSSLSIQFMETGVEFEITAFMMGCKNDVEAFQNEKIELNDNLNLLQVDCTTDRELTLLKLSSSMIYNNYADYISMNEYVSLHKDLFKAIELMNNWHIKLD